MIAIRLKDKTKKFPCPKCRGPVSLFHDYIGSDVPHTTRYYRCPNCGRIIKRKT